MTKNQALKILVKHQKWRRGEDSEMLSPKNIGLAMDIAIFELEKNLKLLEDAKIEFALEIERIINDD